ncbi:MAG TPA: archaeosortase/exosortase family protein, partial [Myxococcales bacterium]|nr:archaeosortase/exosortase family protein [Myxococcales bacterium]
MGAVARIADAALRNAALVLCSAVLVAEYLAVSIAFDAVALIRSARWLSGIGIFLPLPFVIAAGALVRRGAPRGVTLTGGRFRWWLLPVQLALFAGFFELTRRLATPEALLPGDRRAWLAAWFGAGVGLVAALVLALFRARPLVEALQRSWRVSAVATAVGGAAWWAGLAADSLWPALGGFTLAAVAALLRLGGSPVIEQPEEMTVGLGSFAVRVAPVCSGLEGIGLVLVLTTALLVTRRRQMQFPLSLALLPVGAGLAFCANVIRIAALIVIGERWSADLAYGAFHSKAGWI